MNVSFPPTTTRSNTIYGMIDDADVDADVDANVDVDVDVDADATADDVVAGEVVSGEGEGDEE